MTSAHLRKDQADAHPSEFRDSVECASVISIPFLPFDIVPLRCGPSHGDKSNREAFAECAKNLSKRCKV